MTHGTHLSLAVADDRAMRALGARLADALDGAGAVIALRGDLGAGKSTLARGLLARIGVSGPVRSPTYTLIERYPYGAAQALHVDLYRVADPQELDYLGLAGLIEPSALVLIEWPERGGDVLGAPDLDISITYSGSGRHVTLRAIGERGAVVLNALADR